MLNIFSQHLGLSTAELETLLSFSLQEFLTFPAVNELLGSLDTQLLKETLPTAGGVLAEKLPAFYDWLKNELNLQRVPDSPDHTTTWVIGFLNHQESLTRLVELHRPVPRPALERSIPRLLATFDGVEEEKVRKEWQKAIAALCLVLIVAARNEKPYVQSAA
ncbi:hypothetical protein [Allocoleopsis franciscana]|uniref:Uncharacterized protein n=1 Tax=Allocoleopsis franciscana PCC 7113 TaxID=1173027 RepID=K9W7C1_9CYAN|nr:hypothetical protein [Allocoleopsis franciscana]AFZ16098.1 hypothetical protein Mic7113_0161 [Allocoleopsis franciscana PCC 7113]